MKKSQSIAIGCFTVVAVVWVYSINTLIASKPVSQSPYIQAEQKVHVVAERPGNGLRVPATSVLWNELEEERVPPEQNQAGDSDSQLSSSLTDVEGLKSKLDRCDYVRKLLKDGKPIGDPLPTRRSGHVFWLKRALLHTIDPDSGSEVMIMAYNFYNKEQLEEKYSNTIDILTRFHDNDLFPKLFGYCKNVDNDRVLVLEYVPYDAFKLPKPKSLDDCVTRSLLALDTFDRVDALGLTMVDMKPNQWMFRQDGSMVLQDVDDIVPSPSQKVSYPDQERGYYNSVKMLNQMDDFEFYKIWRLRMFPGGRQSIRYPVLGTQMLLEGLGFRWRTDCPGYSESELKPCLKQLFQWSKSIDDEDWPDFSQLRIALEECHKTGKFSKPATPHREWNKVTPMKESSLTCERTYADSKRSSSTVYSRCGNSCCSSNSAGNLCHYTAKQTDCN